MTLYPEDLYELMTPEQIVELQAKLRAQGKVLIEGLPLHPEASEARTQGDWSCRRMAAKKWSGKFHRRRRK